MNALILIILFMKCFFVKSFLSFQTSTKETSIHYGSTENMLFFTPDIHDGTRVDLTSSILDQKHSIYLYSAKHTLPRYYSVCYQQKYSKSIRSVYIPDRRVVKHLPYLYEGEEAFANQAAQLQNDEVFKNVDAIICMFYPSNCLNYLGLNKTVIFIPGHRLFIMLCDYEKILWFIKVLRSSLLYPNGSNVLVYASGLYEREYINYYTGLKVPIIYATSTFVFEPSYHMYHSRSNTILVAPLKLFTIPTNLTDECMRMKCGMQFMGMNALKKGFQLRDILLFKAVIVLPYAVMSYYANDLIATGIPMFVPSPEFLYELRLIRDYKASNNMYCGESLQLPNRHPRSRHPYSPEAQHYTSNKGKKGFIYWIKKSSFYQPNTIVFSSWKDLVDKLEKTDYDWVFNANLKHIRWICRHNKRIWKDIVDRVNMKNRKT